jgi:hypothetical protein
MSRKLRVGDIVEFNYDSGVSWSHVWCQVQSEVINISNPITVTLKVIKKGTHDRSPDVGYISTNFNTDIKSYIIIKSKGSKSHLPEWW